MPAVGVHAFVSVLHVGGQKHGRVLSLNLATGTLEPHVYRTSTARPLTVSETFVPTPTSGILLILELSACQCVLPVGFETVSVDCTAAVLTVLIPVSVGR